MATSHFSYSDYLLYASATGVNEALYSTVAAGVIGILESQYYIYTEPTTVTIDIFVDSTSFYLPVTPVQSITSLTYDGSAITAYTWYGRDVLLSTAVTDTRKPITAVVEAGYAAGSVPPDLKLAVYRHIDAIVYAISQHTDSVEKVINSTGNTTYFREVDIPRAVRLVYDYYTVRTLAKF